MNGRTDMHTVSLFSSTFGKAVLLLIAVFMSLSVLLANRGPLFYFDTGGYFSQGNAALKLVLNEKRPGGGAQGNGAQEEDKATSGSRSMIFAVLMAVFWRADSLYAIALINAAAAALMVWLVARGVRRHVVRPPDLAVLAAIPVIAAATTSLPFYVAYLMPDMFAPILLAIIAVLVAMGRDMNRYELLLAMALATLAIVVHPSHLAIAGLMIPIVAIAAVLRPGPRRWLPLGLVVLMVLIGITERKVFEFAAQTVADKEVVYTPHITARLIVDGPGLDYLNENCPNPEIARSIPLPPKPR
ncbi:MAG TPA: hypothetical protein EYP90_12715 [Chromatiaceae bacterium]|nr:hypothetical protein [Chromatiaceae bacterium]